MTDLAEAVEQVLQSQIASEKPLAIIVAGHNGAGKSTMWNERLAPELKIPLVNADRMMLSILPEPRAGRLPTWAQELRDSNTSWMGVAQQGVDAFVVQAMSRKVPFAVETVFSHWKPRDDGSVESKIDRITELQEAGYFVLLLFVGLSDVQLSVGRVMTRIAKGGHAVEIGRLLGRYPRTQTAIRAALPIADAAILLDNSREETAAFTVCRIQMKAAEVYDLRAEATGAAPEILAWLDVVAPRH